MRIQVVVKLRTGAGKLEAHAARRLRFAVARFGGRVPRARVWIADGPRCTIDVECLVRVRVKGVGEVSVKTVAASPYTAINMAMHRVRQSVERAVQLQLSEQRGGLDLKRH